MAQDKEKTLIPEDKSESTPKNGIKRRTLIKALAGLPVIGLFAYELAVKRGYDLEKKTRVLKELGLQNLDAPVILPSSGAKGDLIRVGLIGYGARAVSHANGLGYMHPDDVEKLKKSNTLDTFLNQEDLNVAVTGICDVFDLHAETGLATINNKLRAGGAKTADIPVKRYRTYQEMLADKNIDAIMIATPDHHHAAITAAAARAGKHVYCEKSIALNEPELNDAYAAVKNSKIVFQLGHQLSQSVVFKQAKEIINKDILGKITLVETTSNRNSAADAWIRDIDATTGKPKPGDEKSIDWPQWLGSTPMVPFSTNRYYNWQKYFAYETGMIGQLFTHEFDSVNQLFNIGIPQAVVSSGGIYFWKDDRDMPDTLHCVFEYPNHDLTLLYSATLENSRSRGRVFMGRDASMELGDSISITVDNQSLKYKKQIDAGIIDPARPMFSYNGASKSTDATTSATEKYYAARGLTTTTINGREVSVTHLHIKEWIDCIRNGGIPSANMERAYEEGIACLMAHRSYLEHRRMEWDPINKKIV
jgi:predicted dehydrogenase